MSQRYFCETPLHEGEILLRGAEAHHLAAVMRAQPGERVVLFDGLGAECDASVAEVGRREVRLCAGPCRTVDREAAVHLTLAVALPKGDRQHWLVEKATELGVARLIPLACRRSVVRIKPGGIERLRRFVVEASKQCGRNRLMQIDPPTDWMELAAAPHPDALCLVAHAADESRTPMPRGDNPSTMSLAHFAKGAPRDRIFAAVGPEGGFSDEEIQAAVAAGWLPISLGPRTLRVETAATALAALLLATR